MMEKMRQFIKSVKGIFLIGQILLLLVWLVVITHWSEDYNSASYGYPVESFYSDCITYDNGWYIDQEVAPGVADVNLLYGPYIFLEKGSYVADIWYECDSNQSFLPYAAGINKNYIKAQTGILDKNLEHVTYHFDVTEDVNNFELQVKYDGAGYLRIKNIEISSDNCAAKRTFTIFLLCLCLVDSYVFFGSQIRRNKAVILSLAGIVFLISLPVFSKGIYDGHDISFHVLRVEGLMQEILAGHIPVKISSLWAAGYGYPVSVYYGDILLYFPVLLRLAGFTIIGAYKAYVVLINIITVVVSYLCFRRMFQRRDIGLLCSLIYSISTYRLMDVYVRASVGEYSAMAFLPLIALGIYGIYVDDVTEWKSYVKNATVLALGMTGVIETHILSTEMVVFVLVLLSIVLWKRTLRPVTIKVYGIAVLETILLNAFFLIPFLDYYSNVQVQINTIVEGSDIKQIQNVGAYLLQYFSFFQTPFGSSSTVIGRRMVMTPGVVMMAALVCAVFLWVMGKADRRMKLVTVFSAFLLYMASNLFPWNSFALHSKIGSMLSQVQFPWRYIGIASIFLAVLTGLVVEKLLELYHDRQGVRLCMPVVALVGICFTFVFVSQYCESEWFAECRDTAELDLYDPFMQGEYLRPVSDLSNLAGPGNDILTENMAEVTLVDRNGTDMELYCVTGDGEGTVTVPMFHYKGYKVHSSDGSEYEIFDGAESRIAFRLPAGFADTVRIEFVEPWQWHLAEAVSLISLLGGVGFCLFRSFPWLQLPVKNFFNKDGKKSGRRG